jgi:hypothetical protein
MGNVKSDLSREVTSFKRFSKNEPKLSPDGLPNFHVIHFVHVFMDEHKLC